MTKCQKFNSERSLSVLYFGNSNFMLGSPLGRTCRPYRRPELAAFPMGRTCISVLTGLAVSDTEKPRYLVL